MRLMPPPFKSLSIVQNRNKCITFARQSVRPPLGHPSERPCWNRDLVSASIHLKPTELVTSAEGTNVSTHDIRSLQKLSTQQLF